MLKMWHPLIFSKRNPDEIRKLLRSEQSLVVYAWDLSTVELYSTCHIVHLAKSKLHLGMHHVYASMPFYKSNEEDWSNIFSSMCNIFLCLMIHFRFFSASHLETYLHTCRMRIPMLKNLQNHQHLHPAQSWTKFQNAHLLQSSKHLDRTGLWWLGVRLRF